MTDTTIRKSIYLKATPAQVWAYLTDPAKLTLWFHRPNTALLEGDYEMIGADSGERFMWGKVLAAEPFRRLEYTFNVKQMGDHTSKVVWTLDEVPGGTHLSLVHDDLPQGAEAFGMTLAFDAGWDKHLGRMRDDANAG